jgi:hypothetical protein
MADSEEPRGDEVAETDTAGDDEGVENGELECRRANRSEGAFGAVFAGMARDHDLYNRVASLGAGVQGRWS